MCGIVGYTGKNSALTPVLDGLRRLEYRGYDSAGIALATQVGKPLYVEKQAGKLKNLEEALVKKSDSNSGIGHTRWATHGGPTDTNAHPHLDNEPQIVKEVGNVLMALKDAISIVLVEQNLGLAMKVADDVVLLNTGRVVFSGTREAFEAQQESLSSHLGVE